MLGIVFRIFGGVLRLAFKAAAGVVKLAWRMVVNRPGDAGLLYVIDGDTLKVDMNGKERSVRLLGIDAPESKMNERVYEQAALAGVSPESIVKNGVAAREKMKTFVRKGDALRLEFDRSKYDKHGRLLAYVWRGGEMLNKRMLETGHARPMFFGGNVKYKREMEEAYSRRASKTAGSAHPERVFAPRPTREKIEISGREPALVERDAERHETGHAEFESYGPSL